MAEQKILISIQINDKDAKKGADGAVKSLSKLERAQKELNYQLSEEAKELARVKAATNDQILANNLAAKSAVNMAKGVKQSRAQSGLNNAILLETSRLASDAGYGFTAIANNLSQVITLFSSFAKTAGGVGNSLKELGKSLIGSGGFLIAIQLLIAFGPQIFAFFERLLGFTREMREAFEGASKTVSDSAGSFEVYIRTLQDASKSQEEQNDAIKALNKEFPEYVKQLKDADLSLKDVANQTKEATRITDEYREAILKQAMSRQAQIKIEESAAKIIDIQIEREAKARDKGYDSLLAAETRFTELSNKKTDQRLDYKEKAEFQRLKRIVNLNDDEIEEENEKIDKLLEFVDIENKERKKRGGRRERDFKQQLLNLEKLEESYRQKSIDQTLMTEDEKINEQEKFAKAELKIRLDQFKERQALRLQEFKESDASAAEKAKAEKEYNESIQLAQQEHDDVMIQLKESFNTKRKQLDRKEAEQAAADVAKAREIQRDTEEQSLQDFLANFDSMNSLFYEKRTAFLQDEIDVQNSILNSVHATETQKQEAIQKTAELQRQLRQNEYDAAIAEIEFKKNIQLEYVGFAEQTSQLLGTLAGKNKALQNAALAIEKGAAIAKVVVQANASVLARKAGNLSLANPALIAADLPLMAADITRIKVGAGLSIANILATTLMSAKKPSSGGDSGGGGGRRTIQAPDFNVVGASQTSQLAQTVATQEAKPVKAFVVGKDISTQQELDRNITNTASFG